MTLMTRVPPLHGARVGVERADPRAVALDPLMSANHTTLDERNDRRRHLHDRGEHVVGLGTAGLRARLELAMDDAVAGSDDRAAANRSPHVVVHEPALA